MAPNDLPFRVLFVCTGNTCRSPMAAAALRASLGAESARVDIGSAGTAARDGEPATPEARAVTAASGLDLDGHRSRHLTPELLRSSDLVLAMEPAHARTVLSLGADPKRTHVLSEWPEPGDPGLGISDPYGGSREAYEECWRRIRTHVERLTPYVLEATRARSC